MQKPAVTTPVKVMVITAMVTPGSDVAGINLL